MKVLLDENLPHRLRAALTGHDVFTAKYMGWSGIKNGKLLALIETESFDVFVTADQPMKDQQDLSRRPFAVVCLSAQEWPILVPHLAEIQATVATASPGSYQRVECGRFRR